MPDLSQVIRQDHAIIEDLLAQIEPRPVAPTPGAEGEVQARSRAGAKRGRATANGGNGPNGPNRVDDAPDQADLLRRLVTTMSVHAAAEEQLVYPRLAKEADAGEAFADQARADHQVMKNALAVLEQGRPGDPEVAAAVRTLRKEVSDHVEAEENDLLPRLREAVGDEEMERLGARFLELKSRAPTRPHPHAPSTPPANIVAGLLAGVVDRARDTVARLAGEHHDEDPTVVLNQLLKGERFAMVTSRGRDGSLRARPLVVQEADVDGDLWFFVGRDSTIHDDVGKKGGHVNVSFSRPDHQRWVSLSGKGHLVEDGARAAELWTKANEAWFPGGLGDPNLALLKVEVTEAEVWDSSSNPVEHAVGIVTSVITGKRYQPGRHRQVALAR